MVQVEFKRRCQMPRPQEFLDEAPEARHQPLVVGQGLGDRRTVGLELVTHARERHIGLGFLAALCEPAQRQHAPVLGGAAHGD